MSTPRPRFVVGRRRAAAGRRAAPHRVRPRVPAGRRHLRDAPRARRAPDRARGARGPAAALGGRPRHRAARRPRCTRSQGGIAALLAAEGLDGPDGDASIRITVSRGAWASRGLLPPRGRATRRDDRDPGVAGDAGPARATSRTACTSSPRRCAATRATRSSTLKTTSRADYVYARLEARRAGADDALFLTMSGHLSESTTANVFLVRHGRRRHRRARDPLARLRDPARHDPLVAARVGEQASGLRAVEGWLTPDRARAPPTRRSCARRSPACFP